MKRCRGRHDAKTRKPRCRWQRDSIFIVLSPFSLQLIFKVLGKTVAFIHQTSLCLLHCQTPYLSIHTVGAMNKYLTHICWEHLSAHFKQYLHCTWKTIGINDKEYLYALRQYLWPYLWVCIFHWAKRSGLTKLVLIIFKWALKPQSPRIYLCLF